MSHVESAAQATFSRFLCGVMCRMSPQIAMASAVSKESFLLPPAPTLESLVAKKVGLIVCSEKTPFNAIFFFAYLSVSGQHIWCMSMFSVHNSCLCSEAPVKQPPIAAQVR